MELVSERGFAARHEWDRLIWPLLLALAWFGLLMGFVPEIVGKVETGTYSFPLVSHLHSVAFLAWMLLFTAQVTLVRTGNVATHRRLGQAGAVLVPVMVVLGLWAGIIATRRDFGTAHNDPGFFAVLLADMVIFAILAGWGLARRRDPASHRRLMMLATIGLTDAGFGRWFGPAVEAAMGRNPVSEWLGGDVQVAVLALAIGAYDLATRRRLHPAYVAGASLLIGGKILADILWFSPWFATLVERTLS
jgi:uncharacterized membrane protein YozB (DUF420 family)